jgi:hypothetical protein
VSTPNFRAIVLHECDCRLQVDASEYHLGFIRLDEEVKKWVCMACKASSGEKREKGGASMTSYFLKWICA